MNNRTETTIPRRAQMLEWSEAEKAIFTALQAVEKMTADVRLTDAVNLLSAAQDSVADFLDGEDVRRSVSVTRAARNSEEATNG